MKNVAHMPQWWEITREQFSPLLICLILALPAALFLRVATGASNLVYGLAVAGALVMPIVLLLRWDELTVTLLIAVHIWIDRCLALHLSGLLLALVFHVAH